MVRNLHLADYITLLNGCCGFFALISLLTFAIQHSSIVNKLPINNNNNDTFTNDNDDNTYSYSSLFSKFSTSIPLNEDQYYLKRAMFLVPLGLFFDFLDGRVARLRHKASLMGQELDSLADLVSFGVAPGSIAFIVGFNTTIDSIFLAIFVLCGLTRLARFNVTVANIPKDAKTGKSKYFEGTPIPTTLALVGLLYYFLVSGQLGDNLPGGVWFDQTPFAFHPLVLLFLAHGSAMISKSLKVPKL